MYSDDNSGYILPYMVPSPTNYVQAKSQNWATSRVELVAPFVGRTIIAAPTKELGGIYACPSRHAYGNYQQTAEGIGISHYSANGYLCPEGTFGDATGANFGMRKIGRCKRSDRFVVLTEGGDELRVVPNYGWDGGFGDSAHGVVRYNMQFLDGHVATVKKVNPSVLWCVAQGNDVIFMPISQEAF
jgi:prepilin-type processing-associated H-X9-DG protein